MCDLLFERLLCVRLFLFTLILSMCIRISIVIVICICKCVMQSENDINMIIYIENDQASGQVGQKICVLQGVGSVYSGEQCSTSIFLITFFYDISLLIVIVTG